MWQKYLESMTIIIKRLALNVFLTTKSSASNQGPSKVNKWFLRSNGIAISWDTSGMDRLPLSLIPSFDLISTSTSPLNVSSDNFTK
jgi:hypothetical protein